MSPGTATIRSASIPSASVADRIVACLEAVDHDGLAALYRPDALLDVNVPEWRYQLQGPAAIRQQFREEAVASPRVVGLRPTVTADGVVVELETRFDHEGEGRLWREVHIFHTDGEMVWEHTVYCTGVWDADTIARQAVEAPMVRP